MSVCLSAIEIKLETLRYKQTYESCITFSREAKYGILISIRIVYGGLRAYIYSTYIKIWLIQYKNLISLYILPDQRRVNLRYFDFDQNRLWGATSLYLFSFSLHFTRSTTGKSIFIFLLFTFYPINEIKLETLRYKQTYESYITFSREAKYGILISIRIVYGGYEPIFIQPILKYGYSM